jgi:hypothetical protein
MSSFPAVTAVILFFVAAWFAWRYYDLKRRMNDYAQLIRNQTNFPTDVKDFENLSNRA